MTTIKQLKNDFQAVKALPHGVERAQRLLSVQRQAAASRAQAGWALACAANLQICITQKQTESADHKTRSIIGSVAKESHVRWMGMTA